MIPHRSAQPHVPSMAIYRGEVGYEELAGKVMQVATAILYDSGQLEWQNGSLWRFDENGFVDQEYVGANLRAAPPLHRDH